MNSPRLILALLSAVSVESAVAANLNNAAPPHRPLPAIQLDVHDALRAEAVSRRRGPNVPQVLRLVDLYREMAAHPQRGDSLVLRKLGLRVRSRLKSVSDRIELQITRSTFKIPSPSSPQATRRGEAEGPARGTVRPASVGIPETHVLAQQFGPAGPGPGAPPAPVPPGAAGGMDYGAELVDVIQQTISPQTWNINGGPGAVVYFTPRRAIVVRAPATVHDQVADLLGQLRAAP